MATGVYQIRNIVTNKLYIGSAAISFDIRWSNHCNKLRLNKHENRKLQNAWTKYGGDAFVFEILEECESEKCVEREQYYLNTILFANCNDNRFNSRGYNICRVAGSWLGNHHTSETKQKISSANKGRVRTKKWKRQRSEKYRGDGNPNFGKTQSIRTRQKIGKLTTDNIREIRDLLAKSELSQNKIAKLFDVHQGTISRIKLGKSWSL